MRQKTEIPPSVPRQKSTLVSAPPLPYNAAVMTSLGTSFSAWKSSFRWRPLSPAAWASLAFWSLVCGLLFYLFHLHGNSQEVANCGHSLFRWLESRWIGDSGDFAYCCFLPLASLFAVWLRRREIAAAPKCVFWPAGALFLFALALHWLGVLAQHPRISAAAFILVLFSLPSFFYGPAVASRLLFPCSYLVLAIPLNFIDSMTSPLRIFATRIAGFVLNGVGIAMTRVGSGLYSEDVGGFNVAAECSGLRSLLAMTALIAFYAWFSQKTLLKKWILFLASIPIAIVANICRIVLVVVVARFFGRELALGLWHDYSGYPIFVISILLVLALDRLLNADWKHLWKRLEKLFFAPASS